MTSLWNSPEWKTVSLSRRTRFNLKPCDWARLLNRFKHVGLGFLDCRKIACTTEVA